MREPAIPTLLGKIFTIKPNSADQNSIDDYFCMLSGLFVPWSDHRPFKPSTVSWRDFFESQTLPPRHLRLQMRAQESHIFEDDEYEDLDRYDDDIDGGDWENAPHQRHNRRNIPAFL